MDLSDLFGQFLGGGILIGYTRLRHLDHLFLTGLAIAYAGSLLAAFA